jgi:membrane protease YdiL (CAAX protease family)
MQTEITNFIAWPPYLIAGFVLGYLYYKTKKIEVSTATHAIWNTLSVLLQAIR